MMWMSEANSKGWILSYFVSEGGSLVYVLTSGQLVYEFLNCSCFCLPSLQRRPAVYRCVHLVFQVGSRNPPQVIGLVRQVLSLDKSLLWHRIIIFQRTQKIVQYHNQNTTCCFNVYIHWAMIKSREACLVPQIIIPFFLVKNIQNNFFLKCKVLASHHAE